MTLTVGFDLDLTLVDSADGIVLTIIEAAGQLGVDLTAEQIRPLVGLPITDIMTQTLPAALAPQGVRNYRRLFPRLGVPTTTPLPGASKALTAIADSGGRAIVVTSTIPSAARLLLRHTGLQVSVIIGSRFAEHKGPAMLAHQVDAYVGDHPGDMTGARAAGVHAIAVTTGAHSRDQLQAAGADTVLASLEEFPLWLVRFQPSAAKLQTPQDAATRR